MKIYSLCLFLVFSLFIPFSCLNGFMLARTVKPTKVVSVEIEHPEVRELLLLIPETQRKEFVQIAKRFGEERNLDWRLLLLSFYQESGLSTTSVSGGFMGLTMFGPDARRALGVTTEQLLRMNHVQQLQLAIRMWAMTEDRAGRMQEFIDLLIINFAPAWYKHHGNPYPATANIKAANTANVDVNGNITKQSILSFFRLKVSRDPKLVYFVGKI